MKKVCVCLDPDTFAQLRRDIEAVKGDGSAAQAASKQKAGSPEEKPKPQ